MVEVGLVEAGLVDAGMSILAVVVHLQVIVIRYREGYTLALFPGSCTVEEEEAGRHCVRMHQISLVTCILLCYTKTR